MNIHAALDRVQNPQGAESDSDSDNSDAEQKETILKEKYQLQKDEITFIKQAQRILTEYGCEAAGKLPEDGGELEEKWTWGIKFLPKIFNLYFIIF